MSDHKPTKKQQITCYNHFQALLAERDGQPFSPLTENAKVQYGNAQILQALISLYGPRCQVPTCKGISAKLELEHINGRKWDYDPQNLRIGCKSCNQEEHRYQVPQPYGSTSKLEKENASTTKSVTNRDIIHARLLQEAPTTFRKSKDYKHQIRILLMRWTARGERKEWDQAINDIVALVGCSRGKAEEYLMDYTASEYQPFEKPEIGSRYYIVRRENINYEKLPDEDRKSYQKAQALIDKENATKIQAQADKAKNLEEELQIAQIRERIGRALGRFVEVSEIKADLRDYAQNPAKFGANGVDGPMCLLCAKRKPMDAGQIVCNSCKAEKGSTGAAK